MIGRIRGANRLMSENGELIAITLHRDLSRRYETTISSQRCTLLNHAKIVTLKFVSIFVNLTSRPSLVGPVPLCDRQRLACFRCDSTVSENLCTLLRACNKTPSNEGRRPARGYFRLADHG